MKIENPSSASENTQIPLLTHEEHEPEIIQQGGEDKNKVEETNTATSELNKSPSHESLPDDELETEEGTGTQGTVEFQPTHNNRHETHQKALDAFGKSSSTKETSEEEKPLTISLNSSQQSTTVSPPPVEDKTDETDKTALKLTDKTGTDYKAQAQEWFGKQVTWMKDNPRQTALVVGMAVAIYFAWSYSSSIQLAEAKDQVKDVLGNLYWGEREPELSGGVWKAFPEGWINFSSEPIFEGVFNRISSLEGAPSGLANTKYLDFTAVNDGARNWQVKGLYYFDTETGNKFYETCNVRWWSDDCEYLKSDLVEFLKGLVKAKANPAA